MQSTGGAVELVERSEGGLGGAMQHPAPPSPCCLFVGLPPAALRERLRRSSFRIKGPGVSQEGCTTLHEVSDDDRGYGGLSEKSCR